MKAIAAIVAALLALVIAAWAKIRSVSRDRDAQRAGRERAELERDAAGGRAAVAEAQADVAADHATRTAAGAAAAEEVHDVPTDLDPAARVRAIDDVTRRLRADEDDPRAGAGGDRAATVRDVAAPRR